PDPRQLGRKQPAPCAATVHPGDEPIVLDAVREMWRLHRGLLVGEDLVSGRKSEHIESCDGRLERRLCAGGACPVQWAALRVGRNPTDGSPRSLREQAGLLGRAYVLRGRQG